jgi:hypothetical protein
LRLSVEITDQIDPRLMRLRLDQCLMRSVKDAPLSSHGDASMRLAQEKDAPLVNWAASDYDRAGPSRL